VSAPPAGKTPFGGTCPQPLPAASTNVRTAVAAGAKYVYPFEMISDYRIIQFTRAHSQSAFGQDGAAARPDATPPDASHAAQMGFPQTGGL